MRVGNLIRLYPRNWRERYGDEFTLILAQQPASARLLLDVVAGAIDARMHPKLVPGRAPAVPREGATAMTKFLPSCSITYSSVEQRRSVAWLIGGTLVLTAVSMILQVWAGENAATEAVGYSAFPIALVFSSHCTYLKPYSRAAKAVIMGSTAALIFVVMLATTLVTSRI